MNKRIIIIAIIIGLFSAGAWYVWQGRDSIAKDSVVGEMSFANWKVYKNEVGNYQINYPDNWKELEEYDGVVITLYDPASSRFDCSTDTKNSAIFVTSNEQAREASEGSARVVRKDEIKVAGVNAVKTTFARDEIEKICGVPVRYIWVIFENGEDKQYISYTFQFYIKDGNTALVDQMLSTFKFIE